MTKLKTFLIVSLILNVFLLGTVAGGTYRWIATQRAAALAQQHGLRFAADELPEARQQQLREALGHTRRDALPLIDRAREGRLDVAQVLAAPQFDRAALDAALARTRDADVALRARIEGTVASFAGSLTPDERLKLVDAMKHHGTLHVGPPPKK
jgi:uncharacterized membrane protein